MLNRGKELIRRGDSLAVCLWRFKEMERWGILAHGKWSDLENTKWLPLGDLNFFKYEESAKSIFHWPQLLLERGALGEPFSSNHACGWASRTDSSKTLLSHTFSLWPRRLRHYSWCFFYTKGGSTRSLVTSITTEI